MARLFASGQAIAWGPGVSRLNNLQHPFSVGLWLRQDDVSGSAVRRWLTVNSVGTEKLFLRAEGDIARFSIKDTGGVLRTVSVDNAVVAGAIAHFLGTFDGSTLRLWKDGVEIGSTAFSGSLRNDATDSVSLSGYPTEAVSGVLAEAAVWNVLLTADEILALARGHPVPRMRADGLRFYVPLWGGAQEPELTGSGLAGTLYGTPSAYDHIFPVGPYGIPRGAPEAAASPTPGLKVYKGTLTSPGATGNQSYSGVGFQPKALIMWATEQTAEGFAAEARFGMGFTDGVRRGEVDVATADNLATSQACRRLDTTRVIGLRTAAGTARLVADIVQFDADGFTLNWTNVAAGAGVIVHYIALGGSDLLAAFVGNTTMPTVVGNQSVTGVGFQPECLLFLSKSSTTDGAQTDFAKMSLGAAVSSAERWGIAMTARGGATTGATLDAVRRNRTQHCLTGLIDDGSGAEFNADLVSMDADGFTLNWETVPASAYRYIFLALRGGRYTAGLSTKPTGSAPALQTIAAGFRPSGVLLASTRQNAVGQSTDWELSVGGTDGARAGASWVEEQDTVINTEVNQSTLTGAALRLATGPSTANADAADDVFDGSNFLLYWNPNDANASRIFYLAFGELPVSLVAIAPSYVFDISQVAIAPSYVFDTLGVVGFAPEYRFDILPPPVLVSMSPVYPWDMGLGVAIKSSYPFGIGGPVGTDPSYVFDVFGGSGVTDQPPRDWTTSPTVVKSRVVIKR